VTRERSSADRRVIYVTITGKATDLLTRIEEPISQLHEKLFGHLTRTELHELSRLLEKARKSLCDDRD
jgi:DNA-binding MarR family transcriptional regulator